MPSSRRNDVLLPALGMLADAVAIECAFLLSFWLRFQTPLLHFLPLNEAVPPLRSYLISSLVVIPLWLLIANSRRMYGARRNIGLMDEFFLIIRVVTLGMLVVMSATFFYRTFSYSRVVFGLLWLSSIFFMSVGRATLMGVERSLYRQGRELRNAVIVGATPTADKIYSMLHHHLLLGYRVIGYIADQVVSQEHALSGARHLGTMTRAAETIAELNVELVVIALGHDEYPKLLNLVEECEGINVEFMMVPDILELLTSRMPILEIEGIPFIKLKGVPMTSWGRSSKRLFDILVSFLLLFLLSPVILLIAILIKLDSRGPVFFRQQRIGLDGRLFDMLKFRSMRADAEMESGPVWAREHDPRRTPVGAFLRKSSIDEVPQLINVLKGEMSLVGPRPERPYFVEQFKGHVPKYLDRHRVKTGMTGWAQVNGLRGNTSLEERIKYDIYYIENWSMSFDVKILFKTIRALVSTKDVH
jgi:exopolysaccharide biosynthesis polyprenyl glycosylphosphotransferase